MSGKARRGTVNQAPNAGSWYFVVDVAPAGAPRRQVMRRGFRTRKEATDALSKVSRSAADGTHVDRSRLTVADWFEQWLGGQSASLRPGTLDSYRRLLARHVTPRVGAIPLQALTGVDLDRVYAEMLSDGRQRGRDAERTGVSARTTRYVHTIARKALADAVRKGLVVRNVADAADPPSHSAAKAPEAKSWSPDELRTFLEHEAVRAHELYPLLVLAGTTGMRRGELCGLAWADVDLDRLYLTVRRQATALRGEVSIGPVKTDRSRRRVDLDPVTVSVLRAHEAARREQRVLIGSGWRDEGLVFSSHDGSVLHPDRVTTAFTRLVKATRSPRITFHGLRHSHAAHMIEAGQHTKHIADRLGHASASFTLDRYGHSAAEGLARAARATTALVWRDAPSLTVVPEPGEPDKAAQSS
jgi:integrase